MANHQPISSHLQTTETSNHQQTNRTGSSLPQLPFNHLHNADKKNPTRINGKLIHDSIQTDSSNHPLQSHPSSSNHSIQHNPTTLTIHDQPQSIPQPQPQPVSIISPSSRIEFPSYSTVLDIRMPISARPSSFTPNRSIRKLSHTSESDVRRRADSNHPFQKLHHQATYLSDHRSIQSNRQMALDRHKKCAHQASTFRTDPVDLILCCHTKYPGSSRPSLLIPLTRRVTPDSKELGLTTDHPDEPHRTAHRSKKRIYLPLQTVLSAGLLIGIPSLFIYSTVSDLINQQRIVGTIILIIFSYIWSISVCSMIKTVTSDPGILPRGLDPNPGMQWVPANTDADGDAQLINSPHPKSSSSPKPNNDPQEQEKQVGLEVGEWELLPRWIKIETFKTKSSRTRSGLDTDKLDPSLVLNRDQRVGWIQSKWCTTCETYRPPRSSHCRICDCCIDGIDHHCSYLNNCIGSRNYRSFFVFLLTTNLDLMIIIACSVWKLFILKLPSPSNNNDSNRSQATSVLNSLKSHPIDIAVITLSLLIFIPISALAGYHIFLTFNGLTTIEHIKTQTTKKVIKENAKLVDQFYNNGQTNPEEQENQEQVKTSLSSSVLSKLMCNSSSKSESDPDVRQSNRSSTGQEQRQQRSNNFVIGRLCRPDTEAFIDWNSLS